MHAYLKTILKLFCAIALITTASCSHKKEFIGAWTATLPTSLTDEIPAAATASSLMSIEFTADETGNSGVVNFSELINITQAVAGDTASFVQPYEVSVSATASISGAWTMKDGEDDELFIAFHPTTLSIDVDPNGVTFSQNVLTGAQQPVIDELTAKTIALWKSQITQAFMQQLSHYQSLDDIEVHSGNILSFEIKGKHGHDEKLSYRRVADD